MSDAVVTRPLVRYHGGKWKLAPWIISQFPAHRVYVEPFGGGASVLLRKPRSYAEIYNDLDGEIVNLFRVVRDHGAALTLALKFTPFARDEFDQAYEPTSDAVERARRTLIRSYMGFGSDGIRASNKTGFRSNANRSGTTPAHDWANYPDALAGIIERLRAVIIENRDAVGLVERHDCKDALFYVDPPYVHSTRVRVDSGRGYSHEMTDQDHRALADTLNHVHGAVIVSGYACDLYNEIYRDWIRIEKTGQFADGALVRTEVLWMRNIQDDLFNQVPA